MSRFKDHVLYWVITVSLCAVAVAMAVQPVGLDSNKHLAAATDGSQLLNLNASNLTTGTAGVSVGGTGLNSLTLNGVLIGNGTGTPTFASTAVSGPVLTGVAGGAPAFADPITSIAGSSTLASTYSISVDNGAYESTGLCETLPAAGTYLVGYEVRTNINATTTSGAFMLVEFYNTTDSAAVANSEEIAAYGSTVSTSYYAVPSIHMVLSVAASKTLCVYAHTVAPASTSVRNVNSDSNGRSRVWYVKLNYQ